ncbi:MAG: hypothetical protein FIA97_08680 [Methylococcaceae bacterium]|nr:hypothetical protein [Methylococcaceae bacterium]
MSNPQQRQVTKISPENLPVSEAHIGYFETLPASGEPHEEDFLFFRNFRSDTALFLDIGGNIGNSALSIFFVCPSWRVISFEPNPFLKYFLDRVSEGYRAQNGSFSYFQAGLGENLIMSVYIFQKE